MVSLKNKHKLSYSCDIKLFFTGQGLLLAKKNFFSLVCWSVCLSKRLFWGVGNHLKNSSRRIRIFNKILSFRPCDTPKLSTKFHPDPSGLRYPAHRQTNKKKTSCRALDNFRNLAYVDLSAYVDLQNNWWVNSVT